MTLGGQEEVNRLLAALTGTGAEVLAIQPQRETLEEYFMHLIGQEQASDTKRKQIPPSQSQRQFSSLAPSSFSPAWEWAEFCRVWVRSF